jgi:hypothetical protein
MEQNSRQAPFGEGNVIGQTSPLLLARPKLVDSVLKWHDVSE